MSRPCPSLTLILIIRLILTDGTQRIIYNSVATERNRPDRDKDRRAHRVERSDRLVFIRAHGLYVSVSSNPLSGRVAGSLNISHAQTIR
jgi:hypothetical protein